MGRSFHSERYQRLVRTLKAERLRGGLTQEDVARALKRPQSFVAKYESGERRLDIVEFAEIAAAISVDAVILFKRVFGSKRD